VACTHRHELGCQLRRLRARRFRSGAELARHLGWPQPRVSKVETGRRLLSQDELGAWMSAVGASPDETAAVVELLGQARLYRDPGVSSGPPSSQHCSQ
jgi:hypothetical protein